MSSAMQRPQSARPLSNAASINTSSHSFSRGSAAPIVFTASPPPVTRASSARPQTAPSSSGGSGKANYSTAMEANHYEERSDIDNASDAVSNRNINNTMRTTAAPTNNESLQPQSNESLSNNFPRRYVSAGTHDNSASKRDDYPKRADSRNMAFASESGRESTLDTTEDKRRPSSLQEQEQLHVIRRSAASRSIREAMSIYGKQVSALKSELTESIHVFHRKGECEEPKSSLRRGEEAGGEFDGSSVVVLRSPAEVKTEINAVARAFTAKMARIINSEGISKLQSLEMERQEVLRTSEDLINSIARIGQEHFVLRSANSSSSSLKVKKGFGGGGGSNMVSSLVPVFCEPANLFDLAVERERNKHSQRALKKQFSLREKALLTHVTAATDLFDNVTPDTFAESEKLYAQLMGSEDVLTIIGELRASAGLPFSPYFLADEADKMNAKQMRKDKDEEQVTEGKNRRGKRDPLDYVDVHDRLSMGMERANSSCCCSCCSSSSSFSRSSSKDKDHDDDAAVEEYQGAGAVLNRVRARRCTAVPTVPTAEKDEASPASSSTSSTGRLSSSNTHKTAPNNVNYSFPLSLPDAPRATTAAATARTAPQKVQSNPPSNVFSPAAAIREASEAQQVKKRNHSADPRGRMMTTVTSGANFTSTPRHRSTSQRATHASPPNIDTITSEVNSMQKAAEPEAATPQSATPTQPKRVTSREALDWLKREKLMLARGNMLAAAEAKKAHEWAHQLFLEKEATDAARSQEIRLCAQKDRAAKLQSAADAVHLSRVENAIAIAKDLRQEALRSVSVREATARHEMVGAQNALLRHRDLAKRFATTDASISMRTSVAPFANTACDPDLGESREFHKTPLSNNKANTGTIKYYGHTAEGRTVRNGENGNNNLSPYHALAVVPLGCAIDDARLAPGLLGRNIYARRSDTTRVGAGTQYNQKEKNVHCVINSREIPFAWSRLGGGVASVSNMHTQLQPQQKRRPHSANPRITTGSGRSFFSAVAAKTLLEEEKKDENREVHTRNKNGHACSHAVQNAFSLIDRFGRAAEDVMAEERNVATLSLLTNAAQAKREGATKRVEAAAVPTTTRAEVKGAGKGVAPDRDRVTQDLEGHLRAYDGTAAKGTNTSNVGPTRVAAKAAENIQKKKPAHNPIVPVTLDFVSTVRAAIARERDAFK